MRQESRSFDDTPATTVTSHAAVLDGQICRLRSRFGALEDCRQLAFRQCWPVLRIIPYVARFGAIEKPERRFARIWTRTNSAHGADDPSLIVDCNHSQRPWLHVHPQNGEARQGKVHARCEESHLVHIAQQNRCCVRLSMRFVNANLSRIRYKTSARSTLLDLISGRECPPNPAAEDDVFATIRAAPA